MKVLSLFSGIGGLDLGLEVVGHKTIFANDIMKVACESYANYFGKYRKTKIFTPAEYNEIIKNDKVLYNRLHHILSENKRVLSMKNALESGDSKTAGRLLNYSHNH